MRINKASTTDEIMHSGDSIAVASAEQLASIDPINKAVSQLDEVTQPGAGLAEQVSAASEAPSDKANEMNKLVSFFRT